MSISTSLAPKSVALPLSERELKTFIDATLRYFEKITQEPAEIGEAAIHLDQPPLLDFTGFIQVTGSCAGFIYVTLPEPMVVKMLASIGETQPDEEICRDFAGEIANTVAGNARQIFGNTFHISIPAPLDAVAAAELVFPAASFVLPVKWRGADACIVIALQQQ